METFLPPERPIKGSVPRRQLDGNSGEKAEENPLASFSPNILKFVHSFNQFIAVFSHDAEVANHPLFLHAVFSPPIPEVTAC
jgi:hypothetical protein